MTGGAVCDQITLALLRRANVIPQQSQNVALDFSRAHKPNRRDAQSLLVDLAAQSHRTRISPTHNLMIRPRCHIKVRTPVTLSQPRPASRSAGVLAGCREG